VREARARYRQTCLSRRSQHEARELEDEEPPVEAAATEQGDVREEEAEVGQAARVPQHAVGDELDEVERAGGPERAAGEEVPPRARDRPDLAAVLVFLLGRGLLHRDRLGVVHGAEPCLLHEVREAEVVAELRVVLDVGLAPHRVDRPVARRDRAAGGLLLAHPDLEAPVEPFEVRPLGRLEAKPTTDVPHLGIRERAHERPQRIRPPLSVRVRERDRVARRLADRTVLRGDLPLARAAEEAHARLPRGDLLDDRVRAVGRAVGGDDDLQELGRVVELEKVLDTAPDDVLLIVCGHDDGHRRRHGVARHRARAQPREHAHRGRISGVRPGESAERPPEDGPDDHAGDCRATVEPLYRPTSSRTSAR
jgi:hypothetical protein